MTIIDATDKYISIIHLKLFLFYWVVKYKYSFFLSIDFYWSNIFTFIDLAKSLKRDSFMLGPGSSFMSNGYLSKNGSFINPIDSKFLDEDKMAKLYLMEVKFYLFLTIV